MTLNTCVDINLSLALSNGKPQLAADLLGLLFVDLAQNQRDISTAFTESRFNEALEMIHKLHGACCYCGVPLLKQACKNLETQLHAQTKMPDSDDIRIFNEAVDHLLRWHQQTDIRIFFSLDK